jgi:energy-coupling factor transporter ATP-binding protein EcfA2/ABC-type multidrug transport system permease subunit
MKRVTIGVELAAQPSVLFLDEPTSGLDARSAKRIMDGVRRVADSGRTIVCTIHQPSQEVFQVFDRLLLLKRGGETVFYGDIGDECVNLISYFEAMPNTTPISHGYNPATWMLECIGAGVGSSGAQSGSTPNFAELFKQSELKMSLDEAMKKDGVGLPSKELEPIKFSSTYAATSAVQMRLLVKRFFDMYWRTASYNLTRLAISVMLALIFGIIYLGADYESYQGVNSGVGMIFVTTLFNAMISFNSGLPIACEERAAFYREQASQMYHPFWYFVGATLAEIPYVVAAALLFTVVFLPMVGFPGFVNGVLYWINVSLIILVMTYIGQFLAYVAPSLDVAMTMGALMSSIQGLFMGFNPPASSIPTAYKWIYHLTPQRYIMGNLVAIALGDCPTPGGDELGCKTLQNAPVSLGTITVRQYVELVFGMHHSDIGKNIGIIFGFILGFRLLAYLALRYINHQKR